MNHARPSHHLLTNAGLLFAVWTLYGLFFATQSYVRMTYYGRSGAWQGVLISWLVCGYAWALLTPAVLWLYRRYPFQLQNWHRFLLVHLPAAAFFAFLHLAIYTTIAQFF